MAIRDVEVTITRQTSTVSQQAFGLPLILATNTDQDYTLYRDLQSVAEDFDEETAAYAIASRIFAQSPRPSQIAIAAVEYDPETDAPTTLTTKLNQQESDYYFLLCDQQGDDEIEALSEWVDTQKKLYFATTDNDALQDTLESDRTILLYHEDPETYAAAAWVGACAPLEVGSYTWKFKTLNGVVASGASETQITNITDNGGNVYLSQGGVLHTYEGVTTAGEFIDVTQSIDFLEARIKESVFGTLVRSPKVPFTNAGIGQVVASVEAPLQTGFDQGIIADDDDGIPLFGVNAPTRGEVSTNDRADRVLPNVNFFAEIAGAIHGVRVNGTVSV